MPGLENLDLLGPRIGPPLHGTPLDLEEAHPDLDGRRSSLHQELGGHS